MPAQPALPEAAEAETSFLPGAGERAADPALLQDLTEPARCSAFAGRIPC